MYTKRIKPIYLSSAGAEDIIDSATCSCLGTRIADQMYHGVDTSISTLLTGQYDDDDTFDVDPACDMHTDRFTLEVKTPVPVSEPPASE